MWGRAAGAAAMRGTHRREGRMSNVVYSDGGKWRWQSAPLPVCRSGGRRGWGTLISVRSSHAPCPLRLPGG